MTATMFELGSTPISADAPGGESVRDDARYEQLEEYFQGVQDVPWDKVVKLASGLLSEKGKDLKVAAQLSVALSEEQSWVGLADAYDCWKGLLSEDIWPHVQPRRPRGQANAISWFIDKVSENVRAASPEPADLETLKSLRATAKEVELLFDERMGEKAPQVASVSRLVKNHIEQLELDIGAAGGDAAADDDATGDDAAPEDTSSAEEATDPGETGAAEASEEPAAKPPKAASSPATKKKASSAAKAPPPTEVKIPEVAGDGASLKEGEKAFRQLQVPVLQTLENIRRGAPERAVTYALARQWVWGLAACPPAKEGKTSIAAPGTRDVTNWEALVGRGEWEELLHSAENRWTKSMFWLDPHRYVGQALDELGLSEARSAVGAGLAELLARLPKLLDLSFSDGTPLADEDTKEWIAKYAKPAAGGAGGGSFAAAPVMMAPVSLDGDGTLPAFVSEAEKLLNENKFTEAVLGFESGLARVPGRRGRFQLKLKFAQQLLTAGRTHVARPMLEALDEEVVRFELETWEPRLAAGVVQTLLATLTSKGQPDEENIDFAKRLLLLRVRLARLDVPSALETGI